MILSICIFYIERSNFIVYFMNLVFLFLKLILGKGLGEYFRDIVFG